MQIERIRHSSDPAYSKTKLEKITKDQNKVFSENAVEFDNKKNFHQNESNESSEHPFKDKEETTPFLSKTPDRIDKSIVDIIV